jgi:hypothetical protein
MAMQIFKLLHRCTMKGAFIFRQGDNLRNASRQVANLPGVYVIYAYLSNGNAILVYYGKAGMNKKGLLTKVQGLHRRLNNVGRNDIPRQQIFNEYILEQGASFLKVHWFVTWDKTVQLNPCSIEDTLYTIVPVNRKIWLT